MRLINVKTLELEEFFGDDIPPYAILSHTWEKEEVSFQDWQSPKSRTKKKGFEKIQSCLKQTNISSIGHCWVDTCCIDKTSSAELTEAINSMYRWYKNSKLCYAYLSDVSLERVYGSPNLSFLEERVERIVKSRWFTRGWTLQELVAPGVVHFYDRDWVYIISRNNAARGINIATGIPLDILRGGDPSTASVAQRMSWASHRHTTRFEDLAYCLLGLFDVHLPLLYGEGKNAFRRLQEEIIKSSDDESIFAWTDKNAGLSSYRGLLADSPMEFESCGDIIANAEVTQDSHDYVLTNKGLRMHFRKLLLTPVGEFLASLNCNIGSSGADVRLLIRPVSARKEPGHFVRVCPNMINFPAMPIVEEVDLAPLYFRQLISLPASHSLHRVHSILLDSLPIEWGGGILERVNTEFTTTTVVSNESWAVSHGKSITLTPPKVDIRYGYVHPNDVTIGLWTVEKNQLERRRNRAKSSRIAHETRSRDIFARVLVFRLHDWTAVFDPGNNCEGYRFGPGRITASLFRGHTKGLPNKLVEGFREPDSSMTELTRLPLKLNPVVLNGMLHLQAIMLPWQLPS